MATRPIDNEWETISGGDDEWEDITGIEGARQQLLNSPVSRAAMAAHPAHRRESEGPPDVPTALGESLQSLGEGAVSAAKGLWHLGTTPPSQLGPELLQSEKARQADITKRASESTPLGAAALQAERTPILGPIAAGAVDLAGKGLFGTHKEFAKTLGEQATPLALGAVAGKVGKGAARQLNEAGNLEASTNDILKAFNVKGTGGAPGAAEAPEIEMVRTAVPEVHHELVTKGADFSKVGQRGFAQAAQRIKKSGWQESVGEDLKKFGHNLEPTTPVAENIYNSIGELTQEANPALTEAIKKRAAIYDGKHRSLNSIHERIKELRKTRESLNNPLTRAEILNTPEMAANMRELEGLEKSFNDRMSTLSGKDYSKLNFRYKALSNVEELARDAAGTGEVEAAKEAATRHKVLDTALQSKGLYEAGTKLTKQAISKVVRNPNDPDLLIGSALKRLGGKSKRVPIGPRETTSAGEPPTSLMQPPPEGPYAGQPGPTEPNQSMEQYLNMNNVSPEAQQFLGYRNAPLKRTKSLSEPPTGKP